jgi:hypothetical protein
MNLEAEVKRLLDSGVTKTATLTAVYDQATTSERRSWAKAWAGQQIDVELRHRAYLAEVRAERVAAERLRQRATEEQQREEDDKHAVRSERARLSYWAHRLARERRAGLTPEQLDAEDRERAQEQERERERQRLEDEQERERQWAAGQLWRDLEERRRLRREAWWEQLDDDQRERYERERLEMPKWADSTEECAANIWYGMEQWKNEIRLEVTEELLSTKIALGDGTQVTWGEATAAQLRQRADMLLAMAAGDVKGAARLRKAAEMIEDADVTCLDDLDAARDGR